MLSKKTDDRCVSLAWDAVALKGVDEEEETHKSGVALTMPLSVSAFTLRSDGQINISPSYSPILLSRSAGYSP